MQNIRDRKIRDTQKKDLLKSNNSSSPIRKKFTNNLGVSYPSKKKAMKSKPGTNYISPYSTRNTIPKKEIVPKESLI